MGEVPGYAKSDKPLLLVADNFPPLIIREFREVRLVEAQFRIRANKAFYTI